MLRKNIRLRREYIYNTEQQNKVKQKIEQKLQIKTAMQNKTNYPTELKKDKEKLQKELKLDDENTLIARTNIDDEYNNWHLREPKLLMTTSRQPSSRLIQFIKEISLVIPNSIRINRGQTVTKELVQLANRNDFTDIVLFHEHRGEPDGMIVSHLPLGPTIFFGIKAAILRHDLKEKPDAMSEAYPHLIFNGFSSGKYLGERVINILKRLFPVPKFESKRVLTFSNQNDIISFRHHVYEKEDYKTVNLKEMGPRFELKPFQIIQGTLGQPEAVKEWVLRPYMNTATKRQAL